MGNGGDIKTDFIWGIIVTFQFVKTSVWIESVVFPWVNFMILPRIKHFSIEFKYQGKVCSFYIFQYVIYARFSLIKIHLYEPTFYWSLKILMNLKIIKMLIIVFKFSCPSFLWFFTQNINWTGLTFYQEGFIHSRHLILSLKHYLLYS